MEACFVDAGSMSIFRTHNRALKTTSLARVTTCIAIAGLPGLFQPCFRPHDLSGAHEQLWSSGTNPLLQRPAYGWVLLAGPSPSKQWDLSGVRWEMGSKLFSRSTSGWVGLGGSQLFSTQDPNPALLYVDACTRAPWFGFSSRFTIAVQVCVQPVRVITQAGAGHLFGSIFVLADSGRKASFMTNCPEGT